MFELLSQYFGPLGGDSLKGSENKLRVYVFLSGEGFQWEHW